MAKSRTRTDAGFMTQQQQRAGTMTLNEILTIALTAGVVLFTSVGGFMWWLAAMYWQLKQAVETLGRIEVELADQGDLVGAHGERITKIEAHIWPDNHRATTAE